MSERQKRWTAASLGLLILAFLVMALPFSAAGVWAGPEHNYVEHHSYLDLRQVGIADLFAPLCVIFSVIWLLVSFVQWQKRGAPPPVTLVLGVGAVGCAARRIFWFSFSDVIPYGEIAITVILLAALVCQFLGRKRDQG